MPLGSFYTAVQEDKMVLRSLFFPTSKGQLGRQVHLFPVMLLPETDVHTLLSNSSKHTLDTCKL